MVVDRDLFQPAPNNLGLPTARAVVATQARQMAEVARVIHQAHARGRHVLLMSVARSGLSVEEELRGQGIDTNLVRFLDAVGGQSPSGLGRFQSVPSPSHMELFALRAEKAVRAHATPPRVVLFPFESMLDAGDMRTAEEFARLLVARFGHDHIGLDIILTNDHPDHGAVRPVLEQTGLLHWT